jgi:DNA repair exonuclease SbcCD nuclease subunit
MAAYPGSPEPLDISETGPRSIYLISFDGSTPSLETIRCGYRTASREIIDCTNLSQEEIVERIASHAGEEVILNAVLTGAPLEFPDTEVLRSRLTGRFCYVNVTDNTSVVETGFVQQIENERTIRGQFVQRLRERISTAETDREREQAELALKVGLVALQKRSAQ